MKVTIELSSIDELRRVLNALDGFESKPMPMMEPAAPKQQYQKPEVLPQAPAETAAPAPVPQPAPAPAAEPEKTYKAVSFDDVTKAAIKLMDAGRQDDLRQLLVKYGVQALPELKSNPAKLAQFYSDLEVM
ncbi:MAG TPA: hypothetical protein DEV97_11010 [Lachnospiraceae bacterium]|nr:hypothetical protein [Lachnospiraceae bacterium]